MKIAIVKFKPSTNKDIQNIPYIQELIDPDYLGIFVHSSPLLEDIAEQFIPTHSFYS